LRFLANKSPYLRITNRKLWTRFRLVPKAMTLNDLERQNSGFIDFLCNFGLRHTYKERIAPLSLDIDQDNLGMKFSASSAVITSVNFGLLHLRNLSFGGIELMYLFQMLAFGLSDSKQMCETGYAF